MSKITFSTIIFCFVIFLNSYAQKTVNSLLTKYNGIYQTSNNGKKFLLKSDSTQIFKIDTTGFVSIQRFKKIDTSFDYNNRPSLTIELDEIGKNQFAALTSNNIGKPLAVVLNNTVYTAPIVNERITQGRLEISGLQTIEEVNKLKSLIDVIKLRTAKE